MSKPKDYISAENKEPPKNVFEKYKIEVPNNLRFYPDFIFFDVETWLKETTQSSQGKLHYSGSHELLSMYKLDGEQKNRANIYSSRNYY